MTGAVVAKKPLVFVIDDDPDVCVALAWLIGSVGLGTRTFHGIAEFLADWRPDADSGCLVLDVRMPGMGGMEFLERMRQMRIDLPVIMLSGHGTIPMATRALRLGAVDFVQKPIDEQLLLDRIQEALARDVQARARREANARLETLTEREREVARLVAAGRQNKEIAQALGASVRTVEGHRARALRKLGIASAAELALLLIAT
ncbi:MAG: hypothetical protein A2514_04710 [Gammaproteobacteria bacterium RIFOXYD12_FULL_61_37]|nr:MAG: hypothetical protein A2514_04710 [Gammaproteobacteria bacterium RIFOXYD12_FULL_61_37]